MRAKNFTPSGNQVLAQVKYYNSTESGILLAEPQKDMFAKLVSCGPQVEHFKPGDMVMFADVAVMHIKMEDEKGKQQEYVIAPMFHIVATYKPDKDEDRIFVPIPEGESDLPDGIEMLGNNPPGPFAKDNPGLMN